MKSRSLGGDSLYGIDNIFHASDDGNSFVVESRGDIQPILERNKMLRENNTSTYRKSEMHMVASIPWLIIAELAKTKGFITVTGKILDQKAYGTWLNSTEAAPYRVKDGLV